MKQFNIYHILFILSTLVVLNSCDVNMSREDSLSSGISVNGSLSSFSIDGDRLYTINNGSLVSYDISSPEDTITKKSSYLTDNKGYVITNMETLFPYGNYLFVGASDGMYIVDVTTDGSPEYVSSYEHVVSCDPVVVQDSFAYVTLRGNNMCGQDVNELQVIDISNIAEPILMGQYELDGPYGLGVDGDLLFVCDDHSLRVMDCSNPYALTELHNYSDILAEDVIISYDHIFLLGQGELMQYDYSGDEIKLLSTINK